MRLDYVSTHKRFREYIELARDSQRRAILADKANDPGASYWRASARVWVEFARLSYKILTGAVRPIFNGPTL